MYKIASIGGQRERDSLEREWGGGREREREREREGEREREERAYEHRVQHLA